MSAEAFARISLNDKQISELSKKPKLSEILLSVIDDAGKHSFDKAEGALLLSLATHISKKDAFSASDRAYVARAVAAGRLGTSLQLEGETRRYIYFILLF